MIVRSHSPYNAEPALDRLRASLITPQSDFYVRSHGNIPHLDATSHQLTVEGKVARRLNLSVADLQQRFPHQTVTAVLQCAGNRRADLQPVKPTSGDPWEPGAIGNACWTGVALAAVLKAAEADTSPGLHVAFDALDAVEIPGEGRFTYGVSIPIAKAMSPEVLLAWAMNGEPLTPEHGFPLRAIVPGYAGVRSPKWLSRVTVQDAPSANHMQQRDYKLFPPDVTKETVNWEQGVTIYDMPINAAICDPLPNAVLRAGNIAVRGYAITTGRSITRVDVSCDGGQSWTQAELEPNPASQWSWTFWHATLDLPKGEHEMVVRAWDSAGQTQPARPCDVWNFKGYLCAAWHRVPVSVA